MGLFSRRRRKKSSKRGIPLLRWFGPGATSLGLLYGVYLLLSGGWSFSSLDLFSESTVEPTFTSQTVSLGNRSDLPPEHIRIATFNIEHFADKKSSTRLSKNNVDVLGKIAQIVSTFDLVAIQEVQGADGIAIKRLLALLNASAKDNAADSDADASRTATLDQYAATMSEPIGDNYFESYAFVWNTRRIQLVPGSDYVVLDPSNRMYREPMVATFQTVVPEDSPQPGFRFTAINVHTKPDRVDPDLRDSEINVLADVFRRVRNYEFQQNREDDFILLGDLNVETANLGELSRIPGVVSLGQDIQTNVSRSKTNDHILIDHTVTSEFAGRKGVIDFQKDLGLTAQQAEDISDHLPLWAEFSLYEQGLPARSAKSANNTRTRVIQ